MQGSGLTKYWGISKEQRAEMPSLDNDKYVMVDNPFNPGEKVVAVPVPKLDTAIIHVQKASPDGTCIIEGDEFHEMCIRDSQAVPHPGACHRRGRLQLHGSDPPDPAPHHEAAHHR